MLNTGFSITKVRIVVPVLLAACGTLEFSAISATAQDLAYGPDTYSIDTSTPSDPSSLAAPSGARLVITGSFTSNFFSFFGANATAAQAAWNAAAQVFMNDFSDPIHVNLTVDAVAGTSVFGSSNTSLRSSSYTTFRNDLVADSKTSDDSTNLGSGGSFVSADPVSGTHTWWVSRAEAKAIGLIPDDLSNDGKTTFGAGNPFTFSGPIAPGTYDFQGVAAHEISEVMGRLGISGGVIGSNSNSFSLIDNESYTGAGVKGLVAGPGNNFSINDGTTLLKLWNNSLSNHLDSRDWASGTNDSFNQFSSSGVTNPVTNVDLRLMDVIGYDYAPVPEPGTLAIFAAATVGLGCYRIRRGLVARKMPKGSNRATSLRLLPNT
jgi:hypothetical protein